MLITEHLPTKERIHRRQSLKEYVSFIIYKRANQKGNKLHIILLQFQF
jgi:hypothetical protein